MLHEGSATAAVFLEFLQRLMIGASAPVFLIVDGHAIHKARIVQDYVDSLAGRLRLFFLPPYSPQLNPGEQVWAHVKGRIAKRMPRNKDDSNSLALSTLRRLQKLPHVVASFFRHPDCAYAC